MRGFDLSIAAPIAAEPDAYAQHQIVWAALARYGISDGQQFLYHWTDSPAGVRFSVRTTRPISIARAARLPSEGRCEIQVLCATRRDLDGGAYTPVPEAVAGDWFAMLMTERGFHVDQVGVGDARLVSGRKSGHHIVLPVRVFTARYRVTDAQRAWAAFIGGIGRAKRFGCGMLRLSSERAAG